MLSVLMATHNGADTIERTLAAMSVLDPPAGGWKLVVVNNASDDDTEALVLNWRDRLPLDYVAEPRLGKSFAMNTALGRAEGDVLVMTDDDVLPARDWLVEWRRVADTYPQCSIFGGAIVPSFDGPPPAWPMPERCYTALYGQTPARAEGEIEPTNVCGANMSIRRSVYEDGWRFKEEFLIGDRGLMGEDTDLVRRLARAGHKVGFAPTAVIRHIIHRRQTTLIWMQRRFVRHGRTMFLLEEAREDSVSKERSAIFPSWRLRAAATSTVRLMLATAAFDKSVMFEQMTAIAYHFGALKEAMALRAQERGR